MTLAVVITCLLLQQVPSGNPIDIGAKGEWVARAWTKVDFKLGLFGRTFEIDGSPVTLEGKPYGMVMEGDRIEGALQPTDEGTVTLQRLRQLGRARVDFSLQRSYAFNRLTLGEEGKSIPESSPKQIEMDLHAPEIVMVTTKAEGTLNFESGGDLKSSQDSPTQLEYLVRGPDKKQMKQIVPARSNVKLDLVFKKAKFFFDPAILTSPNAQALTPLRRGFADGGVTFNYSQEDKPLNGDLPAKQTKLVGRTDRVDFDFTVTPRTIKLTGNIHIDVETEFAKSTTIVREVVMYLDAEMKLIQFTMDAKK